MDPLIKRENSLKPLSWAVLGFRPSQSQLHHLSVGRLCGPLVQSVLRGEPEEFQHARLLVRLGELPAQSQQQHAGLQAEPQFAHLLAGHRPREEPQQAEAEAAVCK